MTFVGDRFVSLGTGSVWLDLVTGQRVRVRVGPAPVDVAARERRERVCRERWSVFTGGRELLDFGRHGVAHWFEAESELLRPAWGPHRRYVWPEVTDLARAIGEGSVEGHVALAAPTGAGFHVMSAQVARAARDAGFVTLRADAPIPFRLRRHLWHRHLILLVPNPAARGHAAGWVSQLGVISDRRHVVIERVGESSQTSSGGREPVRLHPCSTETLIDLVIPAGSDAASPTAALVAAAARSAGWPAAFIRELATASFRSSVMRERAPAYALATVESSPPAALARDQARAATCARRRRPIAESQWHAAAVAAADRRGDREAEVRATVLWVERLVDAGRLSKAIAVATQALAKSRPSSPNRDLVVAAARAHLMAAQVERAATLAASVVAADRLAGGTPLIDALQIELEALFWQGRWGELRARIAAEPAFRETPHIEMRDEWAGILAWADRTDDSARGSGAAASEPDASPARLVIVDHARRPPRWRGEPGLSRAVSIALRRSAGVARPDERSWLDALVRRERLRGLARFEQGTSEMQMLRDMTTLLEIVQTADDERTGLARVGEWLRQAAGATSAAIVSSTGSVVAGEGLNVFGVSAHEIARWCESPEPVLAPTGARPIARAPVRSGGAVVGLVVAVGPERCGRALLDAVQAAAAVCGPLVRGRLDALAAGSDGERLADEILGTSPAIRAVRAAVARVALAPFPVVIEGESGTGKELVARALYRQSARRERAFAALNCAALTDELIDAELFGHARGAFTHAVNARAGLFEEANHGTLFLDEVGDLSPRAQAKLLRALQEGEIRRVGENDARPVDVRVIAATNRPLAVLAADGRFREDLMFRLAVVRIPVPPLRERAEDIPQLALAFWRAAARRVGTHAQLGPDALALLGQLPWPGNVRQLQNAMAALSVAAPRLGRVGARLVRLVVDGLGDTGDAEIVTLDDARREAERRVIAAAMARHVGNRADAARALGLSRQGLAKALRRLGLAQAGAA